MNGITAYFDAYAKKNPHIIAAYDKGLLTVQEATKNILKAMQDDQTKAAVIEILKSYNYHPTAGTIEETAEALVKWYGEEAPEEVNKIYKKEV